MQKTQVRYLGWEDPLEKKMATHSSILAWNISWVEESGELQSMGFQRAGHDWAHMQNCLTMLCWFLLYNEVNQPYVPSLLYLPPKSPHPTPLGHHRAPSWVPCAIQPHPTSCPFHTWQHICVIATVSVRPTLSFLRCDHRSVLYICVYIHALKIGSPHHFSRFHMYLLVYDIVHILGT